MSEAVVDEPAEVELAIVELEIVQIAVDLLDPNPWNPNKQSEVVARATRESLLRFGFVTPLSVRAHPDVPGRFQIINGEHRWTEAVTIGYTEVPCVVLDVTEDEAKKLTVVLNETTGDPDVVLLGQLLADIQHLDDFRVALPYTDTELTHLLSIGQQDWDQFGPAADPPPPPPDDPATSEITIALTPEQVDAFRGFVTILEKEYSLSGVSEVVFEAVRRQALVANQG